MLRFWQLARFNALVFDEVYYVNFAKAYLAGTPIFDAHPPLGKYFIAVGIWLSVHIPFFAWPGITEINPDVGFSPLSYRWMNALVGSLIPLIVTDIAYTLSAHSFGHAQGHLKFRDKNMMSRRWAFALLAGVFVAIDGLFITESRYALINIYLVFFGLLSHWLWLRSRTLASQKHMLRKHVFRLLAGVAFGASIATKWNGLGYGLSLLIWEIYQTNWKTVKLSQLLAGVVYGLLIPGLTYSLIWWPHLAFTGEHLLALNTTLLSFHRLLEAAGHIACSKWYTWPLLIKPFPYWYEDAGTIVYSVSNLGNPLLWWCSSAAIALVSLERMGQLKNKLTHKLNNREILNQRSVLRSTHFSRYLLIGYFSNWLPWLLVSRCTYLYLYMPAAVFAFMLLAWLLSEWLYTPSPQIRLMGWLMLGAIALSFWFWVPLALGSPLTLEDLQMRWWLKSWI